MSTTTRNWKSNIENHFGTLGLIIAKHPAIWLSGFVIIIAALASQLIHIRSDASVEGFLEKGAIEVTQYNDFKNTFGRDEIFMITIEAKDIFEECFKNGFGCV